MKLVYKSTGNEVALGDQVRTRDGYMNKVTHFKPPHKPSSVGHVSIRRIGSNVSHEVYVTVINAEWVGREDR